MNSNQTRADALFEAGQLDEAVRVLGTELRDNPGDVRRRTFLFELLCFSGEYDRAEKQLEVLAQAGPSAELGTLLYRSALHAEKTRTETFSDKLYSKTLLETTRKGTLNGTPFESIADADYRVGARLEVFAGGSYMWIPFEHISSLEIPTPQRLRDLLWTPAVLRTGPGFDNRDLGEVLLPVLTPFSWKSSDNTVRLGRATAWEEDSDGEVVPVGQKMLVVDGEEIPFLEVRRLEFEAEPNLAS